MKIIVSHVYSNDNKGDVALLSVLVKDIRDVFNDPEITILTLDKVTENEVFEGARVENAFMFYAYGRHYKTGFVRFLAGLSLTVSTLWWAVIYRLTKVQMPLSKELLRVATLYQEVDLIIPVGGGYIRAQRGLMNTAGLFFILHPLIFSYVLGKPTICFTQSVGPFGNGFQKFMARFTLKRVQGIIVRENISLALLKKWGITKNVFSSVDSGFSFVSTSAMNIRKELRLPKEKMLVGVTVRNWLPDEKQRKYENHIAQLCDHVIEKYNAAIVFIPQVTVARYMDDDRISSERVYADMTRKEDARVLTEQYDHHTIKALYGGLDYLIGTRFHSVIFSLTSYVPAIAVGYEYKTLGIMKDLGLEEWVVDIQTVSEHALDVLFDTLVVNRELYVTHLKEVLPSYIAKTKEAILFVKNRYEQLA